MGQLGKSWTSAPEKFYNTLIYIVKICDTRRIDIAGVASSIHTHHDKPRKFLWFPGLFYARSTLPLSCSGVSFA